MCPRLKLMPDGVVVFEQVAPALPRTASVEDDEGGSPTLYLASAVIHKIVNIAMVVRVG